LGSFGNTLFIWKENATYQLLGDSRQNFVIDDFHRSEGIVGRWAWCQAEGALYWLSSRNVWRYDGATNQLTPIGDKLGKTVFSTVGYENRLAAYGGRNTLAYHDRKLFLFLGQGRASTYWQFYTYDLERGHWAGPHTGIDAGPVVTTATSEVGGYDSDQGVVPMMVAGNSYPATNAALTTLWWRNSSGARARTDGGSTYTNGSAIAWQWRSKKFDFNPGWQEQVTALRLTVTPGAAQAITMTVYADNGTTYHTETFTEAKGNWFAADTKTTEVFRVPHTILGDEFYIDISGSSTDDLVIHDIGIATRPVRRLR
jgi:hypothetical protein